MLKVFQIPFEGCGQLIVRTIESFKIDKIINTRQISNVCGAEIQIFDIFGIELVAFCDIQNIRQTAAEICIREIFVRQYHLAFNCNCE